MEWCTIAIGRLELKTPLTAAIITFNEERNIERCLISLQGVADEIIVVDSFSKDKTEEICNKYKVRFIQHPFEGHIPQKNFALDQASHDWVLSLDADEALTEELKKSILSALHNPLLQGFQMNRLTNYCGTWIKHSGWYPDTKLRLVNRHHARWTGINPHDRLEMTVKQPVGTLKGDLLHYSYYTREDHLKQIEFFSNIASNELFQRGKKSNYILIYLKVIFQFFKNFVLKLGFLDGIAGWHIARLSAFATYQKYSKLIRLHRDSKS